LTFPGSFLAQLANKGCIKFLRAGSISKAKWKSSELQAVGAVLPHPQTEQLAGSVTVFAGRMNTAGTACTGNAIGTAPVDPANRAWSFRLRNSSAAPACVCAQSPLGGVTERAVKIQ